jgi:hypothetical protein
MGIEDYIEKKNKQRHWEKPARISEKEVRLTPYRVLGLPREVWNKLSPETKRIFRKDAYGLLGKQLTRDFGPEVKKAFSSVKTPEEAVKTAESLGKKYNLSTHTFLDIASRLGNKKASSAQWQFGRQRYVSIARSKGLGSKSNIEDVKKVFPTMNEAVYLILASDLGIKGAGSEGWKLAQKNYILKAKEKGLNEKSSIEDVKKAFPGLSESTQLQIAYGLKIFGSGSELWRRGIAKAKQKKNISSLNQTVDGLHNGQNINMVPIPQDVRMAAGEEYARSLLKNNSPAEIVKLMGERGFFLEETETIMEELRSKRRK